MHRVLFLLCSTLGKFPFSVSLFKDKKGKGAGYPAKESHKLPQRICKFDVIIAFFTTIYAFLLLMKKKEKEKPKFHTWVDNQFYSQPVIISLHSYCQCLFDFCHKILPTKSAIEKSCQKYFQTKSPMAREVYCKIKISPGQWASKAFMPKICIFKKGI